MTTSEISALDTEREPGPLERLLGLFGDVRSGEAGTALLLLLNLFLVLGGYQICKVAREPLILASGGAELKSYTAAGQAVVLMFFIPLYSWFASKVDRARLIFGVTLFFILNIELFWLGARLGVPYLGVAFFIWVGIFNNAIVAQFWSYGNDLYSRPAGDRLFPIIGIGATLGSPFGTAAAAWLFANGVGAYTILQITVVVLFVSIGLYWLVERREGRRRRRSSTGEKLKGGPGGFALLASSPYLRLVCLLIILLNVVNTTGNYVLDKFIVAEAANRAAADPSFNKVAFIGSFAGNVQFWVNVTAALIQGLLVSRIVKYLGLAGALLALPVVALGSYATVAAGATLALVRFAKTAENATDYSVMNTARQMMWLPTSREEKYKAKQAADTFIVRTGDLASAGLVFLGSAVLEFGPQQFASANVVLCVVWLGVALLVLKEYRRLAGQQEGGSEAPSTPPE
jgi:ATP:ADP antiporter, AAA family